MNMLEEEIEKLKLELEELQQSVSKLLQEIEKKEKEFVNKIGEIYRKIKIHEKIIILINDSIIVRDNIKNKSKDLEELEELRDFLQEFAIEIKHYKFNT